MRKSENFDLSLYEGTDIFNPLTTDVPNYEKIDTQMKKNYNLSVGKATELKTGTVHALTRENADCPMIHFTATSNFTSNDTFTVDGIQVSALLVDGSTLPTNCYIIGSEVICYLKGTLLTFFLSGSVSKDSEKLGGELPSYYSKKEDFDQLETTVNSMSGVVEKNSNDIVDLKKSLNDKTTWKLAGSVDGKTVLTLPENFTELQILSIEKTSLYCVKQNILRADLNNAYRYFVGGHYRDENTNVSCLLNISYSALELDWFYVSGADKSTSSNTTVYYR